MKISVQLPINDSKENIWKVIADIENCGNVIESIQEIEIIEKPESGLVGLKWSEKRVLFGKEATETMWISEAVPNEYYMTKAESHGSIYETRIYIFTDGNKNFLGMDFVGLPQTFGAKIMWGLLGFMFVNATKKALQKDLEDIKRFIESSESA